MKDWCLGRIEVFGLVVAEHAPTKGDRSAACIANGEHDAMSEAVVALELACGALGIALPVFAFDYHASLKQIALAFRS